MTAQGRPSKKAKLDDAKIDQVWECFQNYVLEDSVDELQEMVDLISVSKTSSSSPLVSSIQSRRDMLPLLWSTAYSAIAEESMSEYFAISSADSKNDEIPDKEKILADLRDSIVSNVQLSLEYYAGNPMTWSLAANFARTNGYASPSHTASWYLHAAKCSQQLRAVAIKCVDDSETPEELKEWIELLILNHVCGVEVTEEETWSSSAVEGTARFMASMVLSTLNRHDEAAEQLALFPTITHRIHPNVWRDSVLGSSTNLAPSSVEPSACPMSFASPALPPGLYEKLCKVFAPDASYWIESDYDARGYYSYYADLPKETKDFKTSNAIEEAVIHHLLPRVKSQLGEKAASSIIGYEWWIHTRPVSASLGHNLHFDTDESKLAADGSTTHPLVSSVLYLTAPPISGPTIVFQQSPDATENAPFAWYNRPSDNSFMTFPGNLLHGVLPCMPANALAELIIEEGNLKETLLDACKEPASAYSAKHRLSFMVGFWTRRIPDEMKEQKLYGPCGPLPSAEEADWVKELQDVQTTEPAATQSFSPTQLPCATPGWETLASKSKDSDSNDLEIPCAIDHRFFVAEAPTCFRQSLFEKDEEDDRSVIDIEEDISDEDNE